MGEDGSNTGELGSATPTSPVVRCILWHARGSILPGPLVSALDRPTIQWKAWDCDLLTLAELFRPSASPDQLTHDARAKVVLLVDPWRLTGLTQALDTIERYRPGTPLWVFEGGATPKLVGRSIADVRAMASRTPTRKPEPVKQQPQSPPSPQPSLQVVTKPMGVIVPKPVAPRPEFRRTEAAPLRLADAAIEPPSVNGRDSAPGDEPETDQSPAEPAATLLSEAEIEMLLSDPPKPSAGSPKSGGHVR